MKVNMYGVSGKTGAATVQDGGPLKGANGKKVYYNREKPTYCHSC